ncbi:uncharacterized protein LOC118445150 [Vespa mandarinia]|uniref:uncharacterized protein LOC118445150 n=1 Tax=Vespa mandarinia TaxID=7446 RepID=UPI00161AD6F3|nr:uncharacterized protein LOC118445150 [Vespa mandarinia]
MCDRRSFRLKRILCVLSIVTGIVLPIGYCQNAEPRGSFGSKSIARRMDLLRDNEHLDERRFNWDVSLDGEKMLEEETRSFSSERKSKDENEEDKDAVSRSNGENKNVALHPSESRTRASFLRQTLNTTATTSLGEQRRSTEIGEINKARKKNRRTKDPRNNSSYNINGITDVRENEIRIGGGRSSLNENKENVNMDQMSKKSKYSQARKLRGERRRRRKNRDRKRGRKRSRQNEDRKTDDERRRASKFKKRTENEEEGSERSFGDSSNIGLTYGEKNVSIFRQDSSNFDSLDSSTGTGAPSNLRAPSITTTTTTTNANDRKSLPQVPPRRDLYVENVERELSKQLEKEIARSGMINLSNRVLLTGSTTHRDVTSYDDEKNKLSNEITIDDRARFGNSRYDADKMLGYSRTEEDLPILDLENEVLERTMKDYNAYMTSSLKLRQDRPKFTSTSRFHDQPIVSLITSTTTTTRSTTTTTTTNTLDEDNPKGDLSCINGTFLPAPLARHALIKYVKSSIPGHEYLEADYECAPGFYMVSTGSRLLCRNRQWIGQVPKCKLKQGTDGVCSEVSCEHVCKEIDGRAVCSCYNGFRLDAYKCIDVNECEENNGGCEYKCVNTPGSFRCECPKGMKQGEDRFTCIDINECLLNNGHGPCQDTCRNLVGGYECSCEGIQDTVLSADNHTCQNAGPCSVNNAGCSHTCLSTMGRVFCLCPDGFMLEDDWKTCQDVDECAVPDLQTEVCRYGCINTQGSYRCAEPTELKDQPIVDSLSITCLPGYEVSTDGSCVDIDECSIENGGCKEVCENTDGSFFCACDGDEKALSSDGKTCMDIDNVVCPPLNPAGRGYLMCSRMAVPKSWRGRRKITNRPGTKCFLKCPHGYQLHGEYELTCQSDGTWDGPKHGECVRYSKPRLECPKDVVAELPPGRDEAFVTFDQPSTDLDWFRYVRSKPSWGTRLEANLKIGTHEVNFFARHPVSKKQASCVLRIIVKDGEAPKVKDCPNNIDVTGKNGTSITWTEPIFTDNVKVTRISSNESPGRPFDVGGHRIEYEASDEAGWSSKCVFTVVLRAE